MPGSLRIILKSLATLPPGVFLVAAVAGGIAIFSATGEVTTYDMLNTEPATARIVDGMVRTRSTTYPRVRTTYACRIFAEFTDGDHSFTDEVRWRQVFREEKRPPPDCAADLVGEEIPVRVTSAVGNRPAGHDNRLFNPSPPEPARPGDYAVYLGGGLVALFLLWRLWRWEIRAILPGRTDHPD